MKPSNTRCCVVGCKSMRNESDDPAQKIQFYKFPCPSRFWQQPRRQAWVKQIQKFSRGGDWEPGKNSKVCSRHFVDNQKSDHPNHPSYLPTIFPHYKGLISAISNTGTQSTNHLNPLKKRNLRKEETHSTNTTPNQNAIEDNLCETSGCQGELLDEPMDQTQLPAFTTSTSCQTDEFAGPTESLNYFICERYCINTINEAAVQVNIVAKQCRSISSECDLPRAPPITRDFSCGPLEEAIPCAGFHGMSSISKDEELASLANVSLEMFPILMSHMPILPSHTLTQKNQLLLFLMKLKLGLTFGALGVLFAVSRSTASRFFYEILKHLSVTLCGLIYWPSKQAVRDNLPSAFLEEYPDTRAIIDCTEVNTEMPHKIEYRDYMYSKYKSSYTFKFLVACTPNGSISFVSNVYGGQAQDSFITNDCGLLELIEPGDVILADKGFPSIKAGVEGKNALFVMPPYLRNTQLTPEEVKKTYNIAKVRIHIERCIQRIKNFKIFYKFPIYLLPYGDDIVKVICAIVNLQPPIIKNNINDQENILDEEM